MKTSQSKYRQCLYFTSNAFARKMEKLASSYWKVVDLSPSHAYLLMLACDEPGVQPGRIAEELQLQPSTVTRLIEKLEEKKLVVRTVEGKITNVYPTPKAKELYPKLQQLSHQFIQKCGSVFGMQESLKLAGQISQGADKLED